MMDIHKIRQLQKLTNAGLGNCKRALTESGGDILLAAINMLTEQDALAIHQSVRVRSMAGQSIKDPVTEEEQRLVDQLVAHFVAQRTRPLNVGFLFELTELFCSNTEFQREIQKSPTESLARFRSLLYPNGEFEGVQSIETCETNVCTSTVIKMPVSQSEWESDYIVLQHPKKRIFRKSPARVFAIYKRTNRSDRGVANIEEMAIANGEVAPIARWVHEDLSFDASKLATVGFDANKHQVT